MRCVNGRRVRRDARAQLNVHERGASTTDGNRRFEQRQGFVDLAFGNDVGRQQPHHRVGRAVDQELPLQRRFDDRRGGAIDLEPPHHAGAADVLDRRLARRDRAQAALQVRAGPRDLLPSVRRPSAPRGTRAPRGRRAGCRRRCCRDRPASRTAATRSENIAAPIGTPAPSALPSAIRSGCRPSAPE